jgi:hypothetical protein
VLPTLTDRAVNGVAWGALFNSARHASRSSAFYVERRFTTSSSHASPSGFPCASQDGRGYDADVGALASGSP